MLISTDFLQLWQEFLLYVEEKCSASEYQNWICPIKAKEQKDDQLVLEVPNIFVKEYFLTNYHKELLQFFTSHHGQKPHLAFVIVEEPLLSSVTTPQENSVAPILEKEEEIRLNLSYSFDNFIEGSSNQFARSAALGVAMHPGRSYNPLFIHGGVGLGKTHLLHAIAHFAKKEHKKLKLACITTEEFINDIIEHLKSKSMDKLKKFYRSLDMLLVDDIQFLQNRLNFEEELCNTFETLINEGKQIVITSDKPPSQLKLSERLIARMEWGLVAHMGIPELETRVAILQYKAQQKGLDIPQKIAFYIAEHIYNNVRQLEGAVNKLSAHSRLLNLEITEELVERALREMFQMPYQARISVEQILKSVAAVFDVRISDLKGAVRTKEIALPRQVAMYLACKLINDSLQMLGASFGKTHSTLLHARKNIEQKIQSDDTLRRRVDMVERNIAASAA